MRPLSLRHTQRARGGRLAAACVVVLLALSDTATAQDGWMLYDFSLTMNNRVISCADSEYCMVLGVSTRGLSGIVRQTRGGHSWTTVYPVPGAPTFSGRFVLRDLAFPRRDLALISADSGTVLRTTNGGITWTSTKIATSNPLLFIAMADTAHGVVASTDELWRTSDGGLSWATVTIPSVPAITDVHAPDSSTIIAMVAVGTDDFAMRSTDNGATWQFGDTTANIRVADFVDRDIGMACGLDPLGDGSGSARDLAFRTTDGGLTWRKTLDALIEAPLGLHAIDCLDELNAIAVGPEAKILRTVDAGVTWQVESSGLDRVNVQPFTDVAYPGSRAAFIISSTGHFFRKGDGTDFGWSGVETPVPDEGFVLATNSVRRGSPMRVHACGSGPITVELVDLIGSTRLRAVRAADESCGWIEIPTDDLAPGAYLLRVRSALETRTFETRIW